MTKRLSVGITDIFLQGSTFRTKQYWPNPNLFYLISSILCRAWSGMSMNVAWKPHTPTDALSVMSSTGFSNHNLSLRSTDQNEPFFNDCVLTLISRMSTDSVVQTVLRAHVQQSAGRNPMLNASFPSLMREKPTMGALPILRNKTRHGAQP